MTNLNITNISSNNFNTSYSSISNMVVTNVTLGTMNAVNGYIVGNTTMSNLYCTNTTIGSIVAVSSSIASGFYSNLSVTNATSGSLHISNTTASTNTTTGSFINSGDCGVSNIYSNSFYRRNTLTNTYTPLQFGSNFYYGSSLGTTASTSTTYINKATFTTGNLDIGQYIIQLSFYSSTSIIGTSVGYRFYQNGHTNSNIFTGSNTFQTTSDLLHISPFTINNLTSGSIYTYSFDINRPIGAGNAVVSQLNFLTYRVNDSNTT